MTKILFFCSPIGLGHATRDLAIINQMELESCKIFSGSSAIQFFQRNDIEANDVYSPPKFEVQNGKLEKSLKWLWSYYKYYKNCKEISNDIIRKEEPELIISDEDFASIAVAQERGIRNIVITDILETKFTTGFGAMVEKKMNKTMQEMLQKAMSLDPNKKVEIRAVFLPVSEQVDNYTQYYWAEQFNAGVEKFKKIQEDPDNKTS